MGKQDRVVELTGRVGLLSRAALWLVMGALAARLAFEGNPEPGAEPDKQGALHALARQPFGKSLLVVLALGFAATVAWSLTEAFRKQDGERTNHWSHRIVALARSAVYGGLAASTVQVLVKDDQASDNRQEKLTARLLGWPAGRLLVGAVAAALLVAAGYNLYRAVTRRYEKHWDRDRMDGRSRRIAGPVEALGNVGHAMVFALVGWFLSMAALHVDPNEPKSLDESLNVLVHESHGRWLCLLVAAGMVAWAGNALAQSRWRQIPAED